MTENSKIKNFTPCLDVLLAKYGGNTALVYGYIWRLSQLKRGRCDATQATICQALGINDSKTFRKHVNTLITDGYITAEKRSMNQSVVYRPTGKAELENEVFSRENFPTKNDDNEDNFPSSEEKFPVSRENLESQKGKTPYEETIKETKKETKKRENGAGAPPLDSVSSETKGSNANDSVFIAKALAEVTCMDYEKNKGRLLKESKHYTLEDTQRILTTYGKGGAWYTFDWRGKKGQTPALSDIRETWNQSWANISASQDGPSIDEMVKALEPDPASTKEVLTVGELVWTQVKRSEAVQIDEGTVKYSKSPMRFYEEARKNPYFTRDQFLTFHNGEWVRSTNEEALTYLKHMSDVWRINLYLHTYAEEY